MGVDLDTRPGEYQLRIQSEAGAAVHTIQVVPKQFRIRRLRVPGGFVNPPPDALEQIARDRAALDEALALVSARRWSGPFVLPVEGRASSNFGARSYYNGEPRAPHAGVDFAAAVGTPIRAANHGRVVLAASMYFTGNTIVIDYGDRLFSIFAHLSEFRVKAGDAVEPGDNRRARRGYRASHRTASSLERALARCSSGPALADRSDRKRKINVPGADSPSVIRQPRSCLRAGRLHPAPL